MRQILIGVIRVYRYVLSPVMGHHCRFYPTCSCYAQEALRRYGVVHGGALSIRRVLKCHPWHPGGIDEVPDHPVKQPQAPHG